VEVPFGPVTGLQRLPKNSLSLPGVLEVAITLTSRSSLMCRTSLVTLSCIRVDAVLSTKACVFALLLIVNYIPLCLTST
jgi:hypothetical protein